ncbi:RebB family R body protein [Sphingomonas sp. AOB5]|uniref:RebB family R body protein n=1 Tax=Sphingomonas sp. AOB5 TaxID=3034017 RepID=UPI0023F63198|nr:RebB family R body protein [Sphingomonas sp. AOB5]MDF7774539.1 RebB family R body protein [Sphingomonas sp. AOB5]
MPAPQGPTQTNLAHAMGLAMQNAVNQQNQSAILSQAATTQCVMSMLSLDSAAIALGAVRK